MKFTIVLSTILVIISIITIFYVIGNMSGNIMGAGESITDANNCTEGTDAVNSEYYYNFSDSYCYNSTGQQVYVAGQYDLPLNGLFSGTGVIVLMLMAVVLLFSIKFSLQALKK